MPVTRAGWIPAARVFRPIHGRLALGACGLVAAGGGLAFGWELVRKNGTRSSPSPLPAPAWLPVAGAAMIAAGVVSLIAVHLSAPLSTGERLPERLRRPVDERLWPFLVAILMPFDTAMLVSSLVSTHSGDRWEPVIIAAVATMVMLPMCAWTIRQQRRMWGSGPRT